jgi:Predicted permeases
VTDLALHLLPALFLAAVAAGFIDAIAGGGGMVTIPAMLLAGIPPLQVLGTNKLQSLFGSGSASWNYARHGLVDLRAQLPMATAAAAGAACGAMLATVVPGQWLRAALPLLLAGIALYFALKRDIGTVERQRRLGPLAFGAGFVPVVGFYDGVFGPGTGSFLMLGFVALAGYPVLKATAHTKFLNFGSNLGAFAVFLASGTVLWKVGLVMGAGQVLGAHLGSRLAVRRGAQLVRPLLVTVSLLLAARLLADPSHPLRQWLGL